MLFYELLNTALANCDFVMISDAARNFEVASVVCYSKAAETNSIFIAIAGASYNGSLYAFEAVQNGAKAIITDQRADIPALLSLEANVILVESSAKAFALLSRQLHSIPDRTLSLFGVTGTNGKTSTAWMIAGLLTACSIPAAFVGTLGCCFKDKWLQTNNTTPDSGLLYALFDTFLAEGARAAAMEVSSHALAQNRVYGMSFEVGVFTNLTRDHLDYHRTMERYGAAKAQLFEQCRVGIFNRDDPFGATLARTVPCKVLTCSLIPDEADYTARILAESMEGTHFEWRLPDGRCFEAHTATPGSFNVQNALEALAATAEYGLPPEQLCRALPALLPVPGRFEKIPNACGIHVIVDYAHTPDGMEKLLVSLKALTKGRLITVFGCGGNRDVPKRYMMGHLSGKLGDYTVLTSDNPRTENEFDIVQACIQGCEQANGTYTVILDREAAITHAVLMASPGDTVAIMGKGHERYQLIDGLKFPFDDRVAALNALKQK